MRTIDLMTARELRDLRDAGRGHLIDGSRLVERADEARKREKEDPAPPPISGAMAAIIERLRKQQEGEKP